jgi:hypothetical protein
MITNSKLAMEFFKAELGDAYSRGSKDYNYVIGHLLQEFRRHAAHAVLFSIFDSVKAKHAECETAGNYDFYKDASVEVSSVWLPCVAGALTIRSADGDHLLIAWEEEKERRALHVIPWRDPVPSVLIAEAERRIAEGSTLEALMPLAREIAKFGDQPSDQPSSLFDGVPFTIRQIREAIVDDGITKVAKVLGCGSLEVTKRQRYDLQKVVAGPRCETDKLLRLASLFEPAADADGLDFCAADHHRALVEGRLGELYYSLCALVMETNMASGLANLEMLVGLSEKVGLSRTLSLAYADTDLRFHIGNYPPCDVHVHHNIDLNEGNVYATVLNRAAGEYGTVDVYLASPWATTFESYNGKVGPGSVSIETYQNLVRFMARDRHERIGEDELHEALANGIHPTVGKVLSYDIGSRAAEVLPLVQKTGYLTYFENMIEGDLACVAKVEAGDIADLWATEFKFRRDDGTDRDEIITLEDFAKRRSPEVVSPAP